MIANLLDIIGNLGSSARRREYIATMLQQRLNRNNLVESPGLFRVRAIGEEGAWSILDDIVRDIYGGKEDTNYLLKNIWPHNGATNTPATYSPIFSSLDQAAQNSELVQKALRLVQRAHHRDIRYSGDSVFEAHLRPVTEDVINYLAYISPEFQPTIVAAALGHDLLEDTKLTYNDISRELSKDTADLIESLSKHEDQGSRTFKAIADRIDASIIAAADRRNNLLWISYLPSRGNMTSADRQERLVRETEERYIPQLVNFGIYDIAKELTALSYMYRSGVKMFGPHRIMYAVKAPAHDILGHWT